MRNLLDQFKAEVGRGFRLETARDLFALRLAQKLDDADAAPHYASLTETYSEDQLLCAYRRTLRANGNGDKARRFHEELKRIRANGSRDRDMNLISIRVERRTVAIAILDGEHLEFTDSRQLSSARDKAVGSAVGFVNWVMEEFPVESAALEAIPTDQEFHRRVIHDAVCATLRERMLPIWEIPRTEMLEGFGHPPLSSRPELRNVATAIWPVLAGTHAKLFIQDAAILGLYVQTERLFITG
jgi:hypothetical protein